MTEKDELGYFIGPVLVMHGGALAAVAGVYLSTGGDATYYALWAGLGLVVLGIVKWVRS